MHTEEESKNWGKEENNTKRAGATVESRKKEEITE